jgi:hypothetical protein
LLSPTNQQPLSKEHKKYIEKLDIEADVRILEERLNICQEALDHFRAASALLKAGAKNGMTLHEIAIMCCRNDNLAKEPSLLERLTSMASELARTAVANDQWHHTTASRALAEQLTPKRNNLPATPADRSVRFQRCASSAEFISLAAATSRDDDNAMMMLDPEEENSVSSNLSKMLAAQKRGGGGGGSPSMLQSSGSDSSSDAGEAMPDKEEVEEWAHNLIEDSFVAVHDMPIASHHRSGGGRASAGQRSSSISSDDASSDGSNLSSSPKGFWHVPPGKMPHDLSDDDDGSFSWSPHMSPRPLSSPVMDESSLLDLGMPMVQQPVPMPSAATDESINPKRRQSVKFAEHHLSPSACGPFIPPATVQVSLGPHNMISLLGKVLEPPLARQDSTSGMIRSKSYSALSRSSEDTDNDPSVGAVVPDALRPAMLSRRSSTEDDANMRTYFLKFIDLVIVREMTRLSTSKMNRVPATGGK